MILQLDILPTIEVKPTSQDTANIQYMRQYVQDPNIRRLIYEDLEKNTHPSSNPNDALTRFVQLHSWSGKPRIYSPDEYVAQKIPLNKKLNRFFSSKNLPSRSELVLYHQNNGGLKFRSFHVGEEYKNAGLNGIVLSPYKEGWNKNLAITELSHSYNDHSPNGRRILGIKQGSSDAKIGKHSDNYDVIGGVEYNAHNITEPAMKNYIYNNLYDYPEYRNNSFIQLLQAWTGNALFKLNYRYVPFFDPKYIDESVTDPDSAIVSQIENGKQYNVRNIDDEPIYTGTTHKTFYNPYSSYKRGKDDRTYIGGSDQELVVTPQQSYVQPIASKDPYVDYQFYSPTGNSIVQTINSTPRWQQYWADQEGSKVSNAMHQASPKVLDLLTAVDAVATGPEMLEGLYDLYNLAKSGIPKVISKIKPPTKIFDKQLPSGYSLALEDALKDVNFDFEATGTPRTWWDIMLKKRPEIALQKWRQLGLDKNPNQIISDRTSLEGVKDIFNSDWYTNRLSSVSDNSKDIVDQFNRNIDNTTMFARDPGSEFGLEADGRTIPRLNFGIGVDGTPTQVLKNNVLIHPDALSHKGRFQYYSDEMLDELIKHEGLHASSGVGIQLPKEIKLNNAQYHMTPKEGINANRRQYLDIDDEQRVRLLKFADAAEKKFEGDYEKAYNIGVDGVRCRQCSRAGQQLR